MPQPPIDHLSGTRSNMFESFRLISGWIIKTLWIDWRKMDEFALILCTKENILLISSQALFLFLLAETVWLGCLN